MNDSPHRSPSSSGRRLLSAWDRLVQRARVNPSSSLEAETVEPPLGFATRVLADWKEGLREGRVGTVQLWHTREVLAWRGAAIAMAITLAAVAINYDLLVGLWYGDTALAGSLLQTFAAP
ncbi:MAG: hypothetical protein ACAI34_09465 [Verrucomicrobium sp.]|nr:hypothetical protein [Verrucomicrobium sp.]